jgi:hypothetical protein
VVVSLTIAAAAVVGRRFVRAFADGGCERMLARMPDDAPPKRMFRTLEVIRENTERILARLEGEPAHDESELTRAGV